MPEHNKAQILQRKQLLQLHSMRVSACERAYREVERKKRQALKDVEERKAEVDSLHKDKNDAITYGYSNRVAESPTLSKSVLSRRHWVNYDLEKGEYYLALDEDTLEEVTKECDAARKKWLQAQHRESGAQSMLKLSLKSLESALENQQELEAEERVISGAVL